MTGLEVETDALLEIAVVVTEVTLNNDLICFCTEMLLSCH